MAATIGNFADIDDTAVDAESPITESLMTQLRDNAYWIDSSFTKSDQGSADYLLETDGSGGVQWITKDSVSGIDGTKDAEDDITISSSSPVQIAILSNKILHLFVTGWYSTASESGLCNIIIDSSDDTWVHSRLFVGNSSSASSGTITSSYTLIGAGRPTDIRCRKNGGNYEFYDATASADSELSFTWVWM